MNSSCVKSANSVTRIPNAFPLFALCSFIFNRFVSKIFSRLMDSEHGRSISVGLFSGQYLLPCVFMNSTKFSLCWCRLMSIDDDDDDDFDASSSFSTSILPSSSSSSDDDDDDDEETPKGGFVVVVVVV